MSYDIRHTTVAVAGGAGFLGSHLVDHLIEDRHCSVVVIDNLSAGRREFVHKKARLHHHDITMSETYTRRLLEEYDVRFVFNYAAWPYIPDSFQRPLHVFQANAIGAMNVINAAHERLCPVLQVSSAELYGNWVMNGQTDGRNRIMEDDEVHPHSTYGAAKAAVDYYCQAAWKERKTHVVALRQFNCLGERETHPYVVPEIISQLAAQTSLVGPGSWGTRQYRPDDKVGTVRLGNNSTRDFLYAGDAVRMAVELLEKGQPGEVYNLGSESCIEIYELARLVGSCMGFERVEVVPDSARVRPWEIWHLQSNNEKIYSTIEYRPRVALDAAVRRVIADYYARGCRWCWEV